MTNDVYTDMAKQSNAIQWLGNILYILESNPHSVFGDFLNGKKLVCDSNPHLAHWATGWIISDVTDALKSDATPGANES
jgi:hypothetical protein